jgi:hypothetical protein
MFSRSPIVPIQSPASKKLRLLVHQWLWAAGNRQDYRKHRVDAMVAMLERSMNSGTGNGTGTANGDGELKRVADQLSALLSILHKHRTKISFNEELHEYSVNGVKVEQNVTTALEEICGTFDADQTVSRMLSNKYRWKKSKYYQKCNFDEFGNELTTQQAAERLKQTWNEARDNGVRLHSYIEQRYGGGRDGRNARDGVGMSSNSTGTNANVQQPTPPTQSTGSSAGTGTVAAAIPPDSDIASYENWESIRMFNDWLLVASEYPVYSLSCGLAGTIDAIYLPNISLPRQVVLVDWKRATITTTVGNMFYEHPLLMKYAKGNYWKYAMQLNIYREILEKEYGLHVIDMFVVSFPENRLKCEVFGVPKMLEAKTFVRELELRQSRKAAV